ncbi:L,D-transpeptidase family protein [Helicobacter cappadocius]|uniref:L,D-transpeptidase family protein n=1 Tax=Helicobacter cappadocius TaxID=3063998 RepID=A0AA90Q0A1_9HELI|nr:MULTISPECIES: L,D-transpeptidase family protein [unclassified Helicobacter]MDO7253814.1 L,D-transpeptidase family protein [Helicobacter sp. faydin-H75]MDP2539703.1 L,D-transpeptidase family protein [Helicobacter sp. faydin-H76]
MKFFLSISLVASCMLYGMDNQTIDIIQTYRTKGIEATKSMLENYLTQKDFWMGVLQNKDTDYGYYESVNFIFVADKSIPDLALYENDNGVLTKINQTNALVGSGKGNKKVEGDLTTPIGVYDITARLSGLNQYYGPLALVTSYPNTYDKIRKKTGYGIWIHGLPLSGNRKELNTKGCIAVENNTLSQYDKTIGNKKAILISYEQNFKPATKEELATILSDLYKWRDSWIKNDLQDYLSFYGNDFVRYDGMKINAFKDYKKRVFDKKEEKTILFSNINISPYPNEEGKNIFKISFSQDYSAFKNNKITYTSNSTKELYVSLVDGKMSILTEK